MADRAAPSSSVSYGASRCLPARSSCYRRRVLPDESPEPQPSLSAAPSPQRSRNLLHRPMLLRSSTTSSQSRSAPSRAFPRLSRRRAAVPTHLTTLPISLSLPLPLLLLLLPVLLFLAQLAPLCHGFASYFTSGASCYTPLSPGEIIMNAAVIPFEKSARPEVGLQVYSDDKLVKLDRDRESQKVTIHQSSTRASYNLRLGLSAHSISSELADLQFVVELSLGSPSKLVGGNGGCDGLRAHGRGLSWGDDDDNRGPKGREEKREKREKIGKKRGGTEVVLEIDFDGPAVGEETDADDVVKVWAGWGVGFGAVTLTEEIWFVQGAGGGDHNDTGVDGTGTTDTMMQLGGDDDEDDPMDDAQSAQQPSEKKDTADLSPPDIARGAHSVEEPDDTRPSDTRTDTKLSEDRSRLHDEESRLEAKEAAKRSAKKRLEEMRRTVHHVDGGHDKERVVREQRGRKDEENKKKRAEAGRHRHPTAGGDGQKERNQREERGERNHRNRYLDDNTRHRHPDDDDVSTDFDANDLKHHASFRHRYNHAHLGMQTFSMRGYAVGCAILAVVLVGWVRYSSIVGRRLRKGSRIL